MAASADSGKTKGGRLRGPGRGAGPASQAVSARPSESSGPGVRSRLLEGQSGEPQLPGGQAGPERSISSGGSWGRVGSASPGWRAPTACPTPSNSPSSLPGLC